MHLVLAVGQGLKAPMLLKRLARQMLNGLGRTMGQLSHIQSILKGVLALIPLMPLLHPPSTPVKN